MTHAQRAGTRGSRPKLAVWKFASCDGCQLTLLNCEDELIPLAGARRDRLLPRGHPGGGRGALRRLARGGVDHDPGRARADPAGPRGLAPGDHHRRLCHRGGIQALRNFADVAEFRSIVYAHPEYISTLSRSTPIAAHVKVDFELRGCPINKVQLLEVLAAELQGRKPRIPSHSVCVECKRRGNVCVTVAHGTPCLGPVTQAGCGALCPSFDRGCYGCFGPQDTPNTASIATRLRTHGMSEPEVMRVFRTFNAASEAFLRESERHEPPSTEEARP